MWSEEREAAALDFLVKHRDIDGAHHKQWVIDQTIRILAETDYEDVVRKAKAGPDGPDTYGWDEGIAP